jgi:TonB family protein
VLDQFAREARITSQLRHPDIVNVIDFERDGVSYVMVLEYIHGYDLRRWERFVLKERQKFPADVVAYVMIRVLEALHYAHTLRAPDGSPREVIHRDMSPANILVDLDGHVKLTDFGIARMAAEEVTVVTSGMQIKGKLPYVAPELYRGANPSVATDVYACGVMMHELLLGKNEFRATNALETLALASEHIASRVDKVRDDCSKAYADVVEKSLAKTPEKRFKSAAEFATALREVLSSDIGAVEAEFKAMLRQDFQNPEMSRFLQSPALWELDSAWRTAAEATGNHQAASRAHTMRDATEPDLPYATAPTVFDSPMALRPKIDSDRPSAMPHQASVTPPPMHHRSAISPWALVIVAASLVVAGAFAWRGKQEAAPRFVYVQRENTAVADETRPAAVVPASPVQKEPVAAVEKPKELAATTPQLTPEQARAQRMSTAFAQKRPEVEKCFAAHQADVGNRASVQVQFAVDKRGRVTRASLVPDSLTDTKFGECVVKVANRTAFGALPSAVVFRIPITARVVP